MFFFCKVINVNKKHKQKSILQFTRHFFRNTLYIICLIGLHVYCSAYLLLLPICSFQRSNKNLLLIIQREITSYK